MTKTAAELRAEAAQMREFARTVTDPEVLAELNLMIAEWERRARLLDNGGAESCGDDSQIRRRGGRARQHGVTITQRLYEREINFVVSSLHDDSFYVKLGDEMNGFCAEGQCMAWHDVEEWLDGMARIYYPASAFATDP